MAKRVTAEQITRMRELRTAGLSVRQVAARVGVSEATVTHRAPTSHYTRRLTADQIAQIRNMRADGYTCAQVAEVMGCHRTVVHRYAPGVIGKVPVAPLRNAFLSSPMTAADVARELCWWDRGKADSSRVKHTLGLLPDINVHRGRRRRSFRTLADAETVGLIAEAIGIAPWSVMPDDDRPTWATESEAA